MLEILGYIGAVCLAFSPIPQAYLCWHQGHAKGISSLMLWTWLTGEISMLIYTAPLCDIPLTSIYAMNTILVIITLRYKYFPR
jgi:uncharacterized protein with PQ loop repeat